MTWMLSNEKLGGDHCAGNAKNTNGDISTLPVNEESEPMECSSNALDGNDAFSVALRELEALVRLNGFSIHDVPYDGSCMFSAIFITLGNLASFPSYSCLVYMIL